MTRRLATIVVASLALLLATFNGHVFVFEIDSVPNRGLLCRIAKPQYQNWALNIEPGIDLVLYAVLPSFIIVNCNIIIVYNLIRNKGCA